MSGNRANNSNQAQHGKQSGRNWSAAPVQNAATAARQLPPHAQQRTIRDMINGSPTAYQPITLRPSRLEGQLEQRPASLAAWDSIGGPQFDPKASGSINAQQQAATQQAAQQANQPGVKRKASTQSLLKGKPSGSNLRG